MHIPARYTRKHSGTQNIWRWKNEPGVRSLISIRITIAYNKKTVLPGLCLDLHEGEILGLVGHSGCGKSSLALAILGLLGMKGGIVTGSILWNKRELLTLKEKEWLKLRGKEISFVP